MSGNATERERIAFDLLALTTEAMPRIREAGGDPGATEKAWAEAWATLWESVIGYCETDLGVMHGSGESMADWRDALTKRGRTAEFTHHLNGAARERDKAQRDRYADLMAPRIVQKALSHMRGEE